MILTFTFIKKNGFIINKDYYEILKASSLLYRVKEWETLENHFPITFQHAKHYRRFKAVKINDKEIFIKKYLENISEAKREWQNIEFLWKKGFPTSLPIFFYQNKNFALLGTEKVPGITMPFLLEMDTYLIQEFLISCARFLANFHKKGFCHQDCYLNHFYFDPETKSIRIIDVSRVLYKPLLKGYYQIKDLAQLKYSFQEYFDVGWQEKWQFFIKHYQNFWGEKLKWIRWYLIDLKYKQIKHKSNKHKGLDKRLSEKIA